MKLEHLSDAEVLTKLDGVIGSRRRITAVLVAYLGEVEARRLERKEAYSSMYDFCCRKLKLSEGSACRHIAASRVARSYPIALALLREGRLHVTALSMLEKYLDEKNHAERLSEACDKSKAEIERLIRSWHPRPDVPDSIRALPAQAAVSGESVCGIPAGGSADVADATGRPREPRPRVSPLSADRFLVQFSAGSELKAKLERALNLTSHQNPRRDLATLIEKGLDLLLADIEKKKLGKAKHPRRSKGTKNGNFSREARREIYERDGEQCAYVSPSGQRCQAQAFLEMDHQTARARGGPGTSRNGRVLCAAHNALEAEKVFGREFMESRIHRHQRRLNADSSPAPRSSDATDADEQNERGRASAESAIHRHQRRLNADSSPAPRSSDATDADEQNERGRASAESAIHRHQRRLDADSSPAPQSSDATDTSAHNECAQESVESAIHLRQQGLDAESSTAAREKNAEGEYAHHGLRREFVETAIHRHQRRLDAGSSEASVAEQDTAVCEASALGVEREQASVGTPARHLDSCRDEADAASLSGTRALRTDEMEAKLLCALTTMGFRHRESKKALATLAMQPSGADENVARFKTLLRQALVALVPRRSYC